MVLEFKLLLFWTCCFVWVVIVLVYICGCYLCAVLWFDLVVDWYKLALRGFVVLVFCNFGLFCFVVVFADCAGICCSFVLVCGVLWLDL